jgi:hypothetical protein
MAGCCECGDEPSGSCATELVVFQSGTCYHFPPGSAILATCCQGPCGTYAVHMFTMHRYLLQALCSFVLLSFLYTMYSKSISPPEDGSPLGYCFPVQIDHKRKAVPIHAMAAKVERRYTSYSFTTSALDVGEWLASRPGRALPPGKGPPVPIVQEAGWAPEPVWTQRLRKNPLCPKTDQNVGKFLYHKVQYPRRHLHIRRRDGLI